jgi:site-specific DNA-methyltransferase (adenine-specific)
MTFETFTVGDATLYCCDSLKLLETLPDGFVDGVITDPPYSSGGAFRGDRTMGTKAKYMQSSSGNQIRLQEFSGDNRDQRSFHFWSTLWSSEALRASKEGAPALFFTDWRQLPVSTDYLQSGGWVWRGVVPWAKKTARPQMGRFSAQCEYVVWGSAGPLPFERGVGCLPGFYRYVMPDAFEAASPTERDHITQKPLELMQDMVQIVEPGGLILDPFMGSGTTGVAAILMGRKFIGVEQNREHFEGACRRLEEAHKQRPLFTEAPAASEQAGLFPAPEPEPDAVSP